MLRWAGPSLEGCVHVLLLTKRHTATALNHTHAQTRAHEHRHTRAQTCAQTHMCRHTHTRALAQTHAHRHAQTCAHRDKCAHIHIHRHRTHMHTDTRTQIHVLRRTCTDTHAETCTPAHARAHAHAATVGTFKTGSCGERPRGPGPLAPAAELRSPTEDGANRPQACSEVRRSPGCAGTVTAAAGGIRPKNISSHLSLGVFSTGLMRRSLE